jgi:hypothetical protein
MMLVLVAMATLVMASPVCAKHNTNPHPGQPPGWGDPHGGHGLIGGVKP